MKSINKHQITGVILTGGRGSRAQGADKGLLCLDGKFMIERQLDWLTPQVEQVFISANRNIEYYRRFQREVLVDQNPGFNGPLHGVLQALRHSQTNWVFVLPIDLPYLPDATVELLCHKLSEQDQERCPAYYLCSESREHYLSMLIATEALDPLEKFVLDGGQRVRDFLVQIQAKAVDLGIAESNFANLNHAADYR